MYCITQYSPSALVTFNLIPGEGPYFIWQIWFIFSARLVTARDAFG